MLALISFLLIIVLSVSVVRVGSIALELTGLPHEVAIFQSQSAFSGVGFTTRESETVVEHKLRRRIVRTLVLLGSAGITSSIATLILTFVNQKDESFLLRGGILGGGLLMIVLLSRSRALHRLMKKLISRGLEKWSKQDIMDYEEILGISRGYIISRFRVKKDSWLADRTLDSLQLQKEGALILAVFRTEDDREKFIGIPTGKTAIRPGDVLVCYSREKVSQLLSRRDKGPQGEKEHRHSRREEERLSRKRQARGGYER